MPIPTHGASTPVPLCRPTKRATVNQMRESLEQLGLDPKGKKETLFRRLLNAFRRSTSRQPEIIDDTETHITPIETKNKTKLNGAAPSFDPTATRRLSNTEEPEIGRSGEETSERRNGKYKSFLCFDVEATCRSGKEFDYPNEIIEFPVVLLRWVEKLSTTTSSTSSSVPISSGSDSSSSAPKQTLKIIDTFHTYVKPTWRPQLTEFCKSLTRITQETVDASPPFPEVARQFEAWLDKWDLRDGDQLKDALWVTDGPWDLRDFVPKQLHITPLSPVRYPRYFLGPYLNIKLATHTYLSETARRAEYVKNHPGQPANKRALSRISTGRTAGKSDSKKRFFFTITGQLEALGLEFEGQQHSGVADATNVARILMELVRRDVLIEPNGTLHKNHKAWVWLGKPGEILWSDESDSPASLAPVTPQQTEAVVSEPNQKVESETESLGKEVVSEKVKEGRVEVTNVESDETALNALLGVSS